MLEGIGIGKCADRATSMSYSPFIEKKITHHNHDPTQYVSYCSHRPPVKTGEPGP